MDDSLYIIYPKPLTGSENIVRICEAYARNASALKMIMFTVLYTGYGLGKMITTITTNSAYAISIHVITAQMMPQMSCTHHARPAQHLLCMSRCCMEAYSKSIWWLVVGEVPPVVWSEDNNSRIVRSVLARRLLRGWWTGVVTFSSGRRLYAATDGPC